MLMTNMMMTMLMILREWLTLSQPGPQPDDPLDPPGKDAPPLPHHDDDDDPTHPHDYFYIGHLISSHQEIQIGRFVIVMPRGVLIIENIAPNILTRYL